MCYNNALLSAFATYAGDLIARRTRIKSSLNMIAGSKSYLTPPSFGFKSYNFPYASGGHYAIEVLVEFLRTRGL